MRTSAEDVCRASPGRRQPREGSARSARSTPGRENAFSFGDRRQPQTRHRLGSDPAPQSTFIPGIRPGRSTAEYLGKVMARITLASALSLAIITVVLPLFTAVLTGVPSTSLYLGGTAILIVVGVALDTMKQIETQLLMRQYKGFIK
jgi:hypothetical protein